MALEAYSPCPCGSGKKFKWCCQPVHVQIDKAFRQEAEGQHEAALRLMDEVLAAFPDNPEVWGRKAQLLYNNNRAEEAEAALQKAFDINPNYAFGHLLQGMFRQEEGEIPGALILFRKAADLYDPEARDILAQVYSLIAECELQLKRPVAARAAVKMALHCQPANEELRRLLDEVFGPKSRLPAAARRDYTFQSRGASPSASRQEAWERALGGIERAKLSDAVRAFTQLTAENPEDAAALYNLGLAQAWLGDNHGALVSLDRYVELETDEARAADAWALGEVLRFGHGMDEEADYLEYSALFQIRAAEPVSQLLQDWQRQARLVGVQADPERGLFTGLVLERPPALTPALAATQVAGLSAYLLLIGNHLRVWHTSAGSLAQVREELQQRLGPALAEVRREQQTANFNDVMAEALAFPVRATNQEEAKKRTEEHVRLFFEEKWIHRALRSLNRIPPVDAAGHGTLRKKLVGVIRFLQECAALTQPPLYDFDGLRRKLGLLEAPPPAPAAGSVGDVAAMSTAELAALPVAQLADAQLEQAYQAALKLDARDLAGQFARTLVARPARPERPDRFPWYAHLVQLALTEGNTDAALDYLNEGEKADCETNEGRRRNDYELRRGQVHAKRGEADAAQGVFERLIERVPSELRYRSAAAEAMLSARQPGRALQFAQQGLAKAREKNDRDSEDHFKELVAAAQR
jgi:tetratricopeptide (TPR) repeat protein